MMPCSCCSVVATGQVITEDATRVLVLVTVDAEILPVAAVGRVVLVVPVLVMDGEEMEVRAIELPRALGADPPVQRERAFAVALVAGARRLLCLADERVDVDGRTPLPAGRTEAPRRHAIRIPDPPPGRQPSDRRRIRSATRSV